MKILIIGPDRSGKTSVATMLADELGLQASETSDIIMMKLAEFYSRSAPDKDVKSWARTIHVCKEEFRGELTALGDILTQVSPTYLVDEASKRGEIVVGLRRRQELFGYINSVPERVRETILIRVSAPVYQADFELNHCPCDYEVRNDGDMNGLRTQISAVANAIRSRAA